MRKARPFHPPANRESYKDLLIFEERLKQNAERLRKQRRKYEAFLISLVAVIAYLGYIVFVRPSIYSLVHYGNVALLLVALTTLILFFATGMYSEKIAYAHKFVPQANRALRPFNIYLNTRHRSRFSLPFSLFGWSTAAPSSPSATLSRTPSTRSLPDHSSPPLSRQASSSSISSTTSLRSAGALRSPPVSRSPSPTPAPSSPSSSSSRTASPAPSPPPPPTSDDGAVTRAPPSPPLPPPARGIPIPPIPPAQNPRGELIFSSRVAPQFREGYERYRAEWERRRAEARKLQTAAAPGRGGAGWKAWLVRPWRSAGRGAGSTPSSGGSSVGGEKGDKALATGASEQDRGGIMDRDSSVDSASASAAGDTERSASLPRRRSRRSSAGVAVPSPSPSLSPSPSPSPADAWTPSHRPSLSAESITSSTSTPASSCCPSRSPSPARSPPPPPLDDGPPRPRPATASPGRIRAESFSELLELEASEIEGDRQRQNAPPPPLVRTSSRRRSS